MLFNTRELNQLYFVIQEAGFDPGDFDRSHSDTIWDIEYRPTGDRFRLNESPGGLRAGWKIADGPTRERSAAPLRTALEVLDLWLAELKAEMEAPDLWGGLERDRALVQAVGENPENAPFDDADKEAINDALDEIEETAQAAYSLDGAQAAQLAAGIADLREKLDRMGRREWITYAAGTLALLQASVLPPDASRQIFVKLVKAAVNAFGHRYGLSAGP